MKLISYLFLVLLSFSSISLYSLEENDFVELRAACTNRDFGFLGKFAKNSIRTGQDLEKLLQFAQKEKSEQLIRATQFALGIYKKRKKLEIQTGALVQEALFIDTKLPELISKGKYFIKAGADLPYPIEHDYKTGLTFITLEGVKGSLIGEGYQKTITKAILYNPIDNLTAPRLVARAVRQDYKMEQLMVKKLHGAKGLLKTLSFFKRKEKEKMIAVVYSEIYTASLSYLQSKKITFSRQEMMRLALDLLTGLSSMHKRNIVHRDLHTGNYFVNVKKYKGKRKISAVIADFGSSRYSSHAAHLKAQNRASLTAPEGAFFEKMQGREYFATDVFAVGVLLYKLFYDTDPQWSIKAKFLYSPRPPQQNYHELYESIEQATFVQRNFLAQKRKKSKVEDFEYLILRMVHPDPSKRGSASSLLNELKRIIKKQNN
jgi:serine/threonine protein kinase